MAQTNLERGCGHANPSAPTQNQHRINRHHLRGFSTAEMAVVLVLIGILVTIAIPLLTAPSDSGKDRKAQASIMLAYESARIASRSAGGFVSNLPALSENAPELTLRGPTDPSGGPVEVSVGVSDGPARSATLSLAVLSDSDTCWFLVAVPEGANRGVFYARDHTVGALDCTARRALNEDDILTGSGTDWRNAVELP